MGYVVIARWTARPGEEANVQRAIEQLAGPSRAEAGCRFYQPTVDPDAPGAFTLIEIYDDEASYQAHAASEHFQRLAVGYAIERLTSRERTFLATI